MLVCDFVDSVQQDHFFVCLGPFDFIAALMYNKGIVNAQKISNLGYLAKILRQMQTQMPCSILDGSAMFVEIYTILRDIMNIMNFGNI